LNSSNIVMAQLNGGLGNQMFQYANGLAIANRNQAPLGLDTSILQRETSRPFLLHHLNISAKVSSIEEINRLITFTGSSFQALPEKSRQKILPYYRRRIVRERSFGFDSNIFRVRPPVYLAGYWQSEKYFTEIAGFLRKEFTLTEPLNETTRALSIEIGQYESVSIHIRRGDYVTNPVHNQYHGICSLEYYHLAVEILAKDLRQPKFFVFSDDVDWCKQHLKLDYPMGFVAHNGSDRSHEDLWLMSQCQRHIIANSSFSWWGAWLCSYPEKRVIAPIRWFNDPSIDTNDLIPTSWVRI